MSTPSNVDLIARQIQVLRDHPHVQEAFGRVFLRINQAREAGTGITLDTADTEGVAVCLGIVGLLVLEANS